MNTAEIAAVIASVLLATLIIFQLLLAAGLPLAAYAWGGQYEDVLPTNLRWASLVAIPILALAAWSVLAGAGLVLPGAESRCAGDCRVGLCRLFCAEYAHEFDIEKPV